MEACVFGKCLAVGLLLFVVSVNCQNGAKQFLNQYNAEVRRRAYEATQASFTYNTNITKWNSDASVAASLKFSNYMTEVRANASKIDTKAANNDTKRQFKFILSTATSKNKTVVKTVADLKATLKGLYSKGCVNATSSQVPSLKKTWVGKRCLNLDPDLYKIMSKSRNYDELKFVWKGWRDATGPKMKALYEQFVKGLNTGAAENKWKDYGEYVRSWYEVGDQLGPIAEKLWLDLKPFYEELHAYVRFKLTKKYPEVKDGEPIPAHLLGNMWAQGWVNIYNEVAPFPSKLQKR